MLISPLLVSIQFDRQFLFNRKAINLNRAGLSYPNGCDYIPIMALTGNLKAVNSWLRDNLHTEISRYETIGGGCINETGVILLSNEQRLFVKQNAGVPADFFNAEAFGLKILSANTELRIPAVIHADTEFLLMEYLGSGSPGAGFWRELGAGLAQLHSKSCNTFGLERDNYCGKTPQQNTPMADGYEFFARHRLTVLAEKAQELGLLDKNFLHRINRLALNLHNHIPRQPPVLIHGDLWSGNVHCDSEGHPALVDPACYRGWAEAELAMTQLFGGFHQDFYQAYQHYSGIDSDWRERAPLYNLYHLLNHLLLFGTGYLDQIRSVLDRFDR